MTSHRVFDDMSISCDPRGNSFVWHNIAIGPTLFGGFGYSRYSGFGFLVNALIPGRLIAVEALQKLINGGNWISSAVMAPRLAVHCVTVSDSIILQRIRRERHGFLKFHVEDSPNELITVKEQMYPFPRMDTPYLRTLNRFETGVKKSQLITQNDSPFDPEFLGQA